MVEPNALTRQFDDVAQLYDEVRPRYPEELVEHIIAFASLPAWPYLRGRMWHGADDAPVRPTGICHPGH
jgi:hypothetical protein